MRKRASSLRRTDWPTGLARFATSLAPMSSSHRRRAGRDGLHDVVIARAAAEVAFERFADGALVGVRMALHEVDRAHHHARRAEAALERVMLAKRGLHRVQRAVAGDAFDGGDARAF